MESRAQHDKAAGHSASCLNECKEVDEKMEQNSVPATDKQKNFMKKLGIEYPETVTKQQASKLIDEELGKNGR